MLGALQDYRIKQQQSDALSQIPAAQLQQVQTAIQTAKMAQQAEAQKRVAGGLGAMIPDGAKRDDVLSAATLYARSNKDVATNPDTKDLIPAAIDFILNHPKGINAGRAALLNSALSPEAATAPTDVGVSGTGPPTIGTRAQFNARAAQGPVVTTAPPGSAEQRQADEADVAGYNARTNPLRKLVEIEEKLKANGTPIGPGSAGRNRAEAYIATAFPGLVSEATKNKTSLYDEFTKYAAQNAAQLSQGLAPHTNEGLNTVVHGSPNTENVAAGDLAKVQLALEGMRTATLATAQRKDQNGDYVVPLAKVGGEKSRVGLDMDYRAFIPRSDEEWKNLNKTMTGDERKRFNRSYGYGVKAGVIQDEQ